MSWATANLRGPKAKRWPDEQEADRGDGDGRADGDYLGRFTVRAGVQVALPAGQPQTVADASTADLQTGNASKSLWSLDSLFDPTLWTALTGGPDGALTLAFTPMLRARRGRRDDGSDDGTPAPHIRFCADDATAADAEIEAADATDAALPAPPVTPASGDWVQRWRVGGGQGAAGGANPLPSWRIRLYPRASRMMPPFRESTWRTSAR